MATLWSTGIRDFLNNFGSLKQAISGGKMVIYQGTMPTDPDAAIVGTILVSCTTSAGALTSAVAPRWSVQITSTTAVTAFTINSIPLIGATVDTGTIAGNVTALVAAINAYNGAVRYKAWASASDTILLEGLGSLGTTANAFAIAATGPTSALSTPAGGTGGARAGVTSVNGIQLGSSVAGALSTAGIWSGLCVATGMANFFVIYGNTNDDTGASADTTPFHARRIIGTCGTSGADYIMASTALVINKTHTVDTSTITLGASS